MEGEMEVGRERVRVRSKELKREGAEKDKGALRNASPCRATFAVCRPRVLGLPRPPRGEGGTATTSAIGTRALPSSPRPATGQQGH